MSDSFPFLSALSSSPDGGIGVPGETVVVDAANVSFALMVGPAVSIVVIVGSAVVGSGVVVTVTGTVMVVG